MKRIYLQTVENLIVKHVEKNGRPIHYLELSSRAKMEPPLLFSILTRLGINALKRGQPCPDVWVVNRDGMPSQKCLSQKISAGLLPSTQDFHEFVKSNRENYLKQLNTKHYEKVSIC